MQNNQKMLLATDKSKKINELLQTKLTALPVKRSILDKTTKAKITTVGHALSMWKGSFMDVVGLTEEELAELVIAIKTLGLTHTYYPYLTRYDAFEQKGKMDERVEDFVYDMDSMIGGTLTRTISALNLVGIVTVGELLQAGATFVGSLHNVGPRSIRHLKKELARRGLVFNDEGYSLDEVVAMFNAVKPAPQASGDAQEILQKVFAFEPIQLLDTRARGELGEQFMAKIADESFSGVGDSYFVELSALLARRKHALREQIAKLEDLFLVATVADGMIKSASESAAVIKAYRNQVIDGNALLTQVANGVLIDQHIEKIVEKQYQIITTCNDPQERETAARALAAISKNSAIRQSKSHNPK